MTCASTNLAMRIEMALDINITPRKRLANKGQIAAELEYLREACEYWSSLIWSLRMFEAVVARTGLGLNVDPPDHGIEPSQSRSSPRINGSEQTFSTAYQNPSEAPWDPSFTELFDANLNVTMNDNTFGILPITDNYDWLQNLLGNIDCVN